MKRNQKPRRKGIPTKEIIKVEEFYEENFPKKRIKRPPPSDSSSEEDIIIDAETGDFIVKNPEKVNKLTNGWLESSTLGKGMFKCEPAVKFEPKIEPEPIPSTSRDTVPLWTPPATPR